jgi:DnaJ-class molecular chaperone
MPTWFTELMVLLVLATTIMVNGAHTGVGKNYYKILGVDKKADDRSIKKAYRKKAMQHHPDKGGDEARFKEVNTAYEVLSNTQKRELYDMYGEAGLNPTSAPQEQQHQQHHPFAFRGAGAGAGAGAAAGSPEDCFEQIRRAQQAAGGMGGGGTTTYTFNDGSFDAQGSMNMEDILRQMFTGSSGGWGGGNPHTKRRQRQQQQQRQQPGMSEARRRQSAARVLREEYVKASHLYRTNTGSSTASATASANRSRNRLEITKQMSVTLEHLHAGVTKKFRVTDSVALPSSSSWPIQRVVAVDVKAGFKPGTRITFPPSEAFPRIVTFVVGAPAKHSVFGVAATELTQQQRAEALLDLYLEGFDDDEERELQNNGTDKTGLLQRPGLLYLRRTLLAVVVRREREKGTITGFRLEVPCIDGTSRELHLPSSVLGARHGGGGGGGGSSRSTVHCLISGAGLSLSAKEKRERKKGKGDLLVKVELRESLDR